MTRVEELLAMPVAKAIPEALEMLGYSYTFKGADLNVLVKDGIEVCIEYSDMYIRRGEKFLAQFELDELDLFDAMMAMISIRIIKASEIDLGRLMHPIGNTANFKPCQN